MAFSVTDMAHTKESLIADALHMRDFMRWNTRRFNAYTTALTPDVMTAIGLTTDEQATINEFVGGIGRCISLCAGLLPADAVDMTISITQILGVDY